LLRLPLLVLSPGRPSRHRLPSSVLAPCLDALPEHQSIALLSRAARLRAVEPRARGTGDLGEEPGRPASAPRRAPPCCSRAPVLCSTKLALTLCPSSQPLQPPAPFDPPFGRLDRHVRPQPPTHRPRACRPPPPPRRRPPLLACTKSRTTWLPLPLRRRRPTVRPTARLSPPAPLLHFPLAPPHLVATPSSRTASTRGPLSASPSAHHS